MMKPFEMKIQGEKGHLCFHISKLLAILVNPLWPQQHDRQVKVKSLKHQ